MTFWVNDVDVSMIQGVLTSVQFGSMYRNVLAANAPAVVNFDLTSGVPTLTVQTPTGMISTVVAPISNTIPNLVGNGSTPNTAAFNAYIGVGGQLDTLGKTTAVIESQGTYQTDRIDVHPRVDLPMYARGAVIIQAVANMAATVPGAPGTPTGGGAQNSLIRVPRITPATSAILSYVAIYQGFTLDGSTTQANPIIGIRIPDPNPADNPYDPDPTYAGNKDYVATKLQGVEIQHMSGAGYVAEKGNGRSHIWDSRALNCGGNGFEFHTNDVVVGERSGGGGNNGFSFWFGGGSGFLMANTNAWASATYRSITCGAVYSQGTLTALTNNEFNDWLYLAIPAGNKAAYRGGVVGNNMMAPHDEDFSADGVAIDIHATGYLGLQSAVTVEGYLNYVFHNNLFTRSTATTFATPWNIGGDLTGGSGTAFQYLYFVAQSAEVNIFLPVNSAPDIKPWTNANPAWPNYNDPVPIGTATGGKATYYMQDAHTGLHRFGARGTSMQSHVMLSCNENNAPDTSVVVEVGQNGKSIACYGTTILSNVVNYSTHAYQLVVVNNGSTITYNANWAFALLSVSALQIAGATIALPQGLASSFEAEIIIAGGIITNLQWTGTFDNQTIPPPAYINSSALNLVTIRLVYRYDTDSWRIISVAQTANPSATINGTGNITLDLSVSNNIQIVVSANTFFLNPSHPVDGQTYTFTIIMDGIGGWFTKITGSKFKWPGGTNILPTNTAGAISTFTFVYNLYLDSFLLVSYGLNYS